MAKRLWSIFTDDMDHCMYTGWYGVERHHIFSHTSNERDLCEDYGFIAPLRPDLHPNGVHRGKDAGKIDKDLRKRCKAYYLEHYGTEEQFRQEFFYRS
ncbi:phosphoenolpyruvate carboxykinase [Anaerobutyricum hallii]|uniref:phosphoenolpyruvate carboxykinase n=1 Tax=Anaerobutyricum hallii TaxID=39488 RepID=UPI0039A10F3A